MGQPAYDMSSEVRRRKAPQTQRKVALRVEKGGKRRLNPVQAAMQHLLQLISMALLAGLAVSLLWSEAQLVEVNDQIQKAKAAVSYTHLRAHETDSYLVCRLLLEKKKKTNSAILQQRERTRT